MNRIDPDDSPRGLTREDNMKASEVAALLAVPVSTVLHWGRTGGCGVSSSAGMFVSSALIIERLVRDPEEGA